MKITYLLNGDGTQHEVITTGDSLKEASQDWKQFVEEMSSYTVQILSVQTME